MPAGTNKKKKKVKINLLFPRLRCLLCKFEGTFAHYVFKLVLCSLDSNRSRMTNLKNTDGIPVHSH